MRKKAKHILELTRIDHGLIVAFAILAGEIIALKALPDATTFAISALCGIFIQAGSFAIGDFFDVKTDVANRRLDRPLARGDIKPKTAVDISLLCFLIGFILAYTLNVQAFYIAVIFAILGAAYGYYLKNVALVGNIVTATSMAIPFVFGAYVVSSSAPLAVWIIALIAFLGGTGRELIKGVQDYDGDKATGRNTFAIAAGKQNALFSAKALIFLAVLASAVPLFYINEYYMDPIFLALMIINAVVWVKAASESSKMKDLEKTRRETLY
ncbi:UbiA family prenyltransferase, partial [Candidatus Micrarchaeota archaeon]|nr:UbiA family prenyltransferase [Candidatus Micrarchaeota archaeon]